MSTGIGFSVGDIFAGIQLIRDIIAALNDSHGASAEYRAVLTELYALERCVIEVKNLQLDDSQQAQLSAIRAAACQCQRTLDGFGEKLRKYQPYLRAGGSGSLFLDNWKKVQWSLCEKKDIDQLKADLRGHTGSLKVLLMTVQMDSTTIGSRKQEEQSKTILGRIQEASFSVLGGLKTIRKNVIHLLDRTAKILRTNLLIYKTVVEMHNILTRIPGQVESGQLVYLLDARNRQARIPLETIQTKEAFLYVLRNLFRDRGARKIEREEFVLDVRGRNQPIRLKDPWETWFSPGERVDMSMTFPDVVSTTSTCPTCQCHYDKPADVDIECSSCGTTFRRVTELLNHVASPGSLNEDEVSAMCSDEISAKGIFGPERPIVSLKRKRNREEEKLEHEDLRYFRRVRILARGPADAMDEVILPEKVNMFWTEWPEEWKGDHADHHMDISRPLTNEELWKAYDFECHARLCGLCRNAYIVYRKGRSLCDTGYNLAQMVARFARSKSGATEIMNATAADGKDVRLELPEGYYEVQSLLRAIYHAKLAPRPGVI